MRIAFLGLCSLLVIPVQANVVTIAESTSPNGSYYITIDHAPDPAERNDQLEIRSTRTKDVLGSFDWGQFYPNVSENSANVLWKSDSKAFAVSSQQDRHGSGSQVYALNGGHWLEVEIPFFQPSLPPGQHWEGTGRGSYVASGWLENNVLRMNLSMDDYRLDANGQSHLEPYFWVYLRLVRNSDGAHFEIKSAKPQKEQPN
jgi:hypothetical protein